MKTRPSMQITNKYGWRATWILGYASPSAPLLLSRTANGRPDAAGGDGKANCEAPRPRRRLPWRRRAALMVQHRGPRVRLLLRCHRTKMDYASPQIQVRCPPLSRRLLNLVRVGYLMRDAAGVAACAGWSY